LVDPVHSDETTGTKRILAVTYKSKYARPTKPPTIRMFTAESGSNELGLYSITEEVGISPDGHMQHFMDAATMSYEGRTISRSSSQIFFVTQEGSLAMPNYRPNPAQYALVAVVDGVPFSAVPFGHAESEEDQLFALGRAQDLVSQIQAMEPVFGVYRD